MAPELAVLRDYELTLRKDPVPGRAGFEDKTILVPQPCDGADVDVLIREIKAVLPEPNWRPHLQIQKTILDLKDGLPSRAALIEDMKKERSRLHGVLSKLLDDA